MRYLYFILIIILFSCTETDRNFFQNLKMKNHFLDTFSLSNLKKFGLSSKPTLKNGKYYYDFNKSDNSIYAEGSFRKDDGKLFFLPNESNNELLFLDTSQLTMSSGQKVTTRNKSFYEIKLLGVSYNSDLRDSTFKIEMNDGGTFSHPETLLFEINKKLDVLSIEHINCKHDTLMINFFPRQEVYYKYINKSAVCL